jgi:hypothetical protein
LEIHRLGVLYFLYARTVVIDRARRIQFSQQFEVAPIYRPAILHYQIADSLFGM